MRLMLPNKTIWEKEPSLLKALDLEKESNPIISVVGAGGKTSTIEAIALEYKTICKKAIVTTTTHMYQPDKWPWCKEESLEMVNRYLEEEKVLWIGLPYQERKIMSPHLPFLNRIKEYKVPLLIEADGAKRLPFKVPSKNEPVILQGSTMVIGILGMDALCKPIKEVSFNSELTANYLGKSEDDFLTKEDFVNVIRSCQGLKKGVTQGMKYVVILNKVDDESKQSQGLMIRTMLQKRGIDNVLLTTFI